MSGLGFAQALFSAAKGGLCDLADLSGRLMPSNYYPIPSVLEGAQDAFRKFLAGTFCDKPVPPIVPIPPNGNCSISYEYRAFRHTQKWGNATSDTALISGFIQGPISNVRVVVTPGAGGDDGNVLTATDGFGEDRTLDSVNTERSFFAGRTQTVNWTGLEFIPLEPVPPECVPVPVPPFPPYDPADFTFNVDVEYAPNIGPNITVPVAFVVGLAYFDANLDVHVPINVKLNPNFNFNFNNDFDFAVDFNLSKRDERFIPPYDNTKPPPRPPLPPATRPDDFVPDPSIPQPPPSVPDPPPTDPETPKQRVIRAALVTVIGATTSGKVGGLAQNENPDIAIPNFGYINFLCRAGNLSGGWTPDQPVKNARCFIPCPWEGGAYEVKGTPQPGIQFVVTPVYSNIPVGV